MGAGGGPMLHLWTKMELEDNIRPYFLTGEVIINFPTTALHMLPTAPPRQHIRHIRRSFHCKNTAPTHTVKLLAPQFYLISLPRHLHKICDTEDHAAPPFTIFTTAKIYDPSPQLSVTKNFTFQPQLLSTDNSGMELSMLTGKQNACLLYIRSRSEGTTRKLSLLAPELLF